MCQTDLANQRFAVRWLSSGTTCLGSFTTKPPRTPRKGRTKERGDEGKTRPQVEPAGWAGVGDCVQSEAIGSVSFPPRRVTSPRITFPEQTEPAIRRTGCLAELDLPFLGALGGLVVNKTVRCLREPVSTRPPAVRLKVVLTSRVKAKYTARQTAGWHVPARWNLR